MSADIRSTLKDVLLAAKSKLRKARGKSYGERNAKASVDDSPAKDSGAPALSDGPLGGKKSAKGIGEAQSEVRTEMAMGGAGLIDEMKDFMSNRVKRPTKKTAKGKPANIIIAEAKNPNGKKGK